MGSFALNDAVAQLFFVYGFLMTFTFFHVITVVSNQKLVAFLFRRFLSQNVSVVNFTQNCCVHFVTTQINGL